LNIKKKLLKGLIMKLHQGAPLEEVKEEFIKNFGDVSPSEIAEIEQSLIDEGLPESEVKRLCDVHVEVFKHSLDRREKPRPPSGHPVHNLMAENRAAENILGDIEKVLQEIGESPDDKQFEKFEKRLRDLVESLWEIDKHYLKKENQLFPRLEAKGMSGPSQVMWTIHDEIRQIIKDVLRHISEMDLNAISSTIDLIQKIRDMIYKEENILYPMSLDSFTVHDWLAVKEGEEEIGYAWIEPLTEWTPEVMEERKYAKSESELLEKLKLDVGSLTREQVNLILTHVLFDITFVNENDEVEYYSQGKERIFPRSPGIIGRTVQRCHPPKSVHVVEKILGEFKSGTKDVAEFWIRAGEKLIHIRYFAVRDNQRKYKGTLEVSQDITNIKLLKGERRLLDWEIE